MEMNERKYAKLFNHNAVPNSNDRAVDYHWPATSDWQWHSTGIAYVHPAFKCIDNPPTKTANDQHLLNSK